MAVASRSHLLFFSLRATSVHWCRLITTTTISIKFYLIIKIFKVLSFIYRVSCFTCSYTPRLHCALFTHAGSVQLA